MNYARIDFIIVPTTDNGCLRQQYLPNEYIDMNRHFCEEFFSLPKHKEEKRICINFVLIRCQYIIILQNNRIEYMAQH